MFRQSSQLCLQKQHLLLCGLTWLVLPANLPATHALLVQRSSRKGFRIRSTWQQGRQVTAGGTCHLPDANPIVPPNPSAALGAAQQTELTGTSHAGGCGSPGGSAPPATPCSASAAPSRPGPACRPNGSLMLTADTSSAERSSVQQPAAAQAPSKGSCDLKALAHSQVHKSIAEAAALCTTPCVMT